MKQSKTVKKSENKFIFSFLKWLILIIIVVLIIFVVTTPHRKRTSDNYIKKGDQHLNNKKYLSADLAYQKALILNPKSQIAKDRRNLALEAQNNVLVLEAYYSEVNNLTQIDYLSEINNFPENESAALKLSKLLIENGEYQLAIIPAETATQMAPDYAVAWQFLGIVNQKVAESIEINLKAKEKYQISAEEAFAKAQELNPELLL